MKTIGGSLLPLLLAVGLSAPGGALAAALTRGPYLQSASDSAITFRWRTDSATDSVVRYGSSPTTLDQTVTVSGNTTEHSVAVQGLAPLTQYYYSVGSSSETLAGGDSSYRFTTAPTPGSSVPTRIWLIGDAGTANANQAAVYNAYLNDPGAGNTALWIMLGDNAYNDGTDAQYQDAVFDMYPELLRRSPVWATLGNHDGHSADSGSESGPYYDIFTLPRNGEAGGLPSGTEAYYAFDYGDIHFICLDSYDSDRSANGAMMTWLANDIAATDRNWIIAFWHHPPYTKGSHDSDSESALRNMREVALPILEDYGVDLVFSGHSHSYERSYLIDSHYGASNTFGAQHQIDGGDGREDGNGAYQKDAASAHAGAVYTVAGSSGKTSGGSLNHPAMFSSRNELGSVVLDINGNRLDARFLRADGSVTDYYSLNKGPDGTPPTLSGASAATASSVEVAFSETVDAVTAGNPAHYSIDNGVSVLEANASGSTVTLNTSTLSEGLGYTLTVNDVEDSHGNVIAANSQAGFSYLNIQTVGFQDGVDGYAGTQDSWIGDGVPASNFGNDSALLADGADGSNGETASLVQWDLGAIPAGASVTDAQIELDVFGVSAGAYRLYAGSVAWDESTVSWNSIDPYATRGAQVGSFVPSSTGRHSITLNTAGVAMIQSWIDGGTPGGVLIMTGGTSDGLDLRSSEYGTATQRPKLIVTYSAGSGGNSAPLAGFSYSADALDVDFNDSSTDGDGSIVSWSWDFGDGNVAFVQHPSHAFAAGGSYAVSLTVMDDQGAQDSDTQTLQLSAAPDTEPPSVPNGLVAGTVTASTVNLSWNAASDNMAVSAYTVRRDGQPVGETAATAFADSGLAGNQSYSYTVEARDAAGNRSGESLPLVLSTDNAPPSAGFSFDTEQLDVYFTDSSSDSDGTIASWAWDFGDGNGSTLPDPVHRYTGDGTYSVTLTVYDNDGGEDSDSQSVAVSDGSEPVTVNLQQGLNGYNGAQDSYVASGSAGSNYGNSGTLLADGDDGPNDELVTLLKWDLSTIPAGATVTAASITLRVFNKSNSDYVLWEQTSGWNESGVTWNNADPASHRGAQIGSFTPTSTGSFTIDLNASGIALLQGWIDGNSNDGISIQSSGTYNGIDMRSSEYGTQSHRPLLTLTYE